MQQDGEPELPPEQPAQPPEQPEQQARPLKRKQQRSHSGRQKEGTGDALTRMSRVYIALESSIVDDSCGSLTGVMNLSTLSAAYSKPRILQLSILGLRKVVEC